jgi:small subunit ribosomal protein S16
MSLVIRSMRTGKKGERKFRIVVKEKRSRRDGDYLELIGWYEKTKPENKKQIKMDRYNYWVSKGAQPSDAIVSLVK